MDKKEIRDELIIGVNPILEALKAGRDIDTIYISRGSKNGSIGKIKAVSRNKGILIKETDNKKLDYMCGGASHQGVVAKVAAHKYAELSDLFKIAEEKNEPPFFIICDEVEDPHNLGAIIRSAECAGAHGVIIPKRRSASLNYTVDKSSAGALEYMPVVRVSNLSNTMDELKKKGVWIYGTDMEGEPWCTVDLKGPLALVVGSEGTGMGRLVSEKCDFTLTLPLNGKIQSLNASVAAGICMYEVSRQRLNLKAF